MVRLQMDKRPYMKDSHHLLLSMVDYLCKLQLANRRTLSRDLLSTTPKSNPCSFDKEKLNLQQESKLYSLRQIYVWKGQWVLAIKRMINLDHLQDPLRMTYGTFISKEIRRSLTSLSNYPALYANQLPPQMKPSFPPVSLCLITTEGESPNFYLNMMSFRESSFLNAILVPK